MTQTVSYVTIGRLTRPHGIRGQVCAQYYAQSLQYLEDGKAFIKTEKSAPRPLIVDSYKEQGNILVLKIKGVHTRTEAEFLRNFDIVIDDALLDYEDREMSCENEHNQVFCSEALSNLPEDSSKGSNKGANKALSEASHKTASKTAKKTSSDALDYDFNQNSGEIFGLNGNFANDDAVTSASVCSFSDDLKKPTEQTPYLYHLIGAKTYLCQKYIAEQKTYEKRSLANTSHANTSHANTSHAENSLAHTSHVNNCHADNATIQAEEEPYLGVIEDIIFPADQEIWLIKTEKEEEILFPAVSQFIDRYDLSDLSNVKVYLYPPNGLLEIYMETTTK